jgi:hypothetical protein
MTRGTEPIRFQGHIPYPPEQRVDDWGLDATEQVWEAEAFRHTSQPWELPSAGRRAHRPHNSRGCQRAVWSMSSRDLLSASAASSTNPRPCCITRPTPRSHVSSSFDVCWRNAAPGGGRIMVSRLCVFVPATVACEPWAQTAILLQCQPECARNDWSSI